MSIRNTSSVRYALVALAPLLLILFVSVHGTPAYAIAQGQSCTGTVDNNECDKALVCYAGTCQPLSAVPVSAGGTAPATGAGMINTSGAGMVNTTSGGSSGGLQNPLKVGSLTDLLKAILDGIVQIGSIFLIFMLVYVGFLFVAARGNQEKIQAARSALVWTVIGGLILLGASAISLVIQATVTSISATP